MIDLPKPSSPPIGAVATRPAALKILVTSRKGGVGKSTISANLAAFFKLQHKLTTTLLDLDLHGSSSDWLREARPIGVVVQHHPLPLDLGRKGAAMEARRHLRHAAESSDVVIADLTWSDALDGNWLFDYDIVLTPVSMSGIEVAATIGFLSNLHWVFESTVRTAPQLIICPSRVDESDSISKIFTSQTFPISFVLSPPVYNYKEAKFLFKKDYLSELPGDQGTTFKTFAQSIADVGFAHMRSKVRRNISIGNLSKVSGDSAVLTQFMQQRTQTNVPKANATTTLVAEAPRPHPPEPPKKSGLFKRLFG